MVFLDFKWTASRSTLFVGLAALLLFVVGPQLGSLDADGDGVAEVPVALANTNIATGISALACGASSHRTTRTLPKPVEIPSGTYRFGVQELKSASPIGRLGLQLFCPLRC